MNSEQIEILQKAINKYGAEKQLEIVVEENAELIQAISKLKRKRIIGLKTIPIPDDHLTNTSAYFNFIGELADVKIMLAQAELMLCETGKEALNISIDRKIENLNYRLMK